MARPRSAERKEKFAGPVMRVREVAPADPDLVQALWFAQREVENGHDLPAGLVKALMVFLRAQRKEADKNIIVNTVRRFADLGHPVAKQAAGNELVDPIGGVTAFEAAARELKESRYGSAANIARIWAAAKNKG